MHINIEVCCVIRYCADSKKPACDPVSWQRFGSHTPRIRSQTRIQQCRFIFLCCFILFYLVGLSLVTFQINNSYIFQISNFQTFQISNSLKSLNSFSLEIPNYCIHSINSHLCIFISETETVEDMATSSGQVVSCRTCTV